jgi:lysophospholipase L1-like esterase
MIMRPLLSFLSLFLLSAAAVQAEIEFQPSGHRVKVSAGEGLFAGKKVVLASAAELEIPPPTVHQVESEPLHLSAEAPAGYKKGTRLRALKAGEVNAFGALKKLELRREPGGPVLSEGVDFLADHDWGGLGLASGSSLTPANTVYATYSYQLQRLDTIQVAPGGAVSVKVGTPHISVPLPPAPDSGHTAIAHVYTTSSSDGGTLAAEQIFPIQETADQAVTSSTSGRIPKTLAKLRAGEPVTIVCWGDSVTAGGNASSPANRYVDVFARELQGLFPKSKISVQNLSAGGSNSRQWLYPEKFKYRSLEGEANPARFERVLAAKPDLVTLEFVNDASVSGEALLEQYDEIRARLDAVGAELILITPHFTMLKMMGFKGLREPERRPYVLSLRKYAEEHHVALADASARWEHLWKEGLPYLTLLDNTINHPDDRGHRLFVDELLKCFR